jgi:hypothetical protein
VFEVWSSSICKLPEKRGTSSFKLGIDGLKKYLCNVFQAVPSARVTGSECNFSIVLQSVLHNLKHCPNEDGFCMYRHYYWYAVYVGCQST